MNHNAALKGIVQIAFLTLILSFSIVRGEAQSNRDDHPQIITADGSPERHIQLIQTDTGSVENIANFSGASPLWSPDGKKIAAYISDETIGSISVLDIQGRSTNEWGVANSETVSLRDFFWSPDSKVIAMLRCWQDELDGCAIDLLDIEQNKITRMADNFPQFAYAILAPDFKQIFYSPQDNTKTRRHSIAYVFNVETGKSQPIINGEGTIARAKWSPDSTKIAYLYCLTSCSIFAVNSDGTNQQKLANYRASISDFSWSPDSGSIIFSSGHFRYEQAFIVELDTANWTNIVGLGIRFPQFSADGKEISYLRCDDETTCALVLAALDGTQSRPLTVLDNTLFPPSFAWSPL